MTQDKGLTVNAVPDNDGTGSDKDFNPQTMPNHDTKFFARPNFGHRSHEKGRRR